MLIQIEKFGFLKSLLSIQTKSNKIGKNSFYANQSLRKI